MTRRYARHRTTPRVALRHRIRCERGFRVVFAVMKMSQCDNDSCLCQCETYAEKNTNAT